MPSFSVVPQRAILRRFGAPDRSIGGEHLRDLPLLGDGDRLGTTDPEADARVTMPKVFAASLSAAAAALVFASWSAAAGNPEIAALQVGLRNRGLYAGTVDGVLGLLVDAGRAVPAPGRH